MCQFIGHQFCGLIDVSHLCNFNFITSVSRLVIVRSHVLYYVCVSSISGLFDVFYSYSFSLNGHPFGGPFLPQRHELGIP